MSLSPCSRRLSDNVFFVLILVCLVILLGCSCRDQEESDAEAVRQLEASLRKEAIPDDAIRIEKGNSILKKNREDVLLADPNHMWVGPANNILVTDVRENAVVQIDPNGDTARKIGQFGSGPGDFAQPLYIGTDRRGNIFVYEGGNQRVQILDKEGNYIRSFKTYRPCYSMDVDNDGLVYLCFLNDNINSPLINVFSSWGQEVTQFGARIDAGEVGSFNNICIRVTDRHVWVAWRTYPIIRKYTKSGEMISEIIVNYGRLQELGTANRLAKRSDRAIRYWKIINDIDVAADDVYILRTYPRLVILRIDPAGHAKNVYWSEIPFGYIAPAFKVLHKNGKPIMLVLETYPIPDIGVYHPQGPIGE